MSVQEVENMTLAQKRMAAMIMETTAEDVEAHRQRQAAAEAEAAAAVGSAGVSNGNDETAMEESDDEDQDVAERKRREDEERAREIERARAIQASSMEAGAPMKIRTGYVPNRKYLTVVIVLQSFNSNLFQCQHGRMQRRSLHVRFAVSKFLSTSSRSTCVLSFLTRGGNLNVTSWRPAKLNHPSCSVVPTLYPPSRTWRVRVWISSVLKKMRRSERERRKRNVSSGGRGKSLFGMVIPLPRQPPSTSLRRPRIGTSRLLHFTERKVLDREC